MCIRDRDQPRPLDRELQEQRLDSMPLVAVRREQEGTHGREPPRQRHIHPTSKYRWRCSSDNRLHGGSDAARALHGRLLLLPGGQAVDFRPRSRLGRGLRSAPFLSLATGERQSTTPAQLLLQARAVCQNFVTVEAPTR